MNFIFAICIVVVTLYVSDTLNTPHIDDNEILTYTTNTAVPKNCRAITTDVISKYNVGTINAEDALKSIDKNCGETGEAWIDNREAYTSVSGFFKYRVYKMFTPPQATKVAVTTTSTNTTNIVSTEPSEMKETVFKGLVFNKNWFTQN